jgi:hypothetical protein
MLTTAIILAIQPLLRWGFRFAAPLWWAREAELESLPAQLRCGACRGIGDTHMCELAPIQLWRCGTCPRIIPGSGTPVDVRIREHEHGHKEAA